MAEFEEFYFDSSTGNNKIRALVCKPEGNPRGAVQIAHGISEHMDRYREFMAFLADNGFLVSGCDHLGHGKSVTRKEEKGMFHPEDGWNKAVADLVTLHDLIAQKYPDIPYIFFGHSMGSFLTRTLMIDYPDKYDMAIISGTGHQPRLLLIAGNIIAQHEVKKNGYSANGKKLLILAMGSYLKRIKNPRTPCDWLSRDEAVVDSYMNDEMCGFTARAGLYADMLWGIKYVTDMENIKKMDPDKPVCFLSGTEDPVGDYGKGVKKAYDCFKKAGVKDVSLLLYEGGRHEMLNELNKNKVYEDILGWLIAKV